MIFPDYQILPEPADPTLALNEFYFICDASSHYLKTKESNEFDEVSTWGNIIFKGKIKSHQFIHYKIAQTWHKKSFMRLQTSAPIEVGVFDVLILQDENSGHISELKIGGREKTETYESL